MPWRRRPGETTRTSRSPPFTFAAAGDVFQLWLAGRMCDLLDQPEERARLGSNARAFAKATYDLKTVCLPRQIEWVRGLAQG